MSRIIVLDRDGVINYDSRAYIKSVSEFKFIPGSVEAIAQLTQAGYRIGVVTNQSGISRGLYSEETLQEIHAYMTDTLQKAGGRIEAICYCPHLPIERCSCRKPQPGMFRELSQKMGLELTDFFYAGDRISDIQVAKKVGAKAVLIESSMTDKHALTRFSKILVYPSLFAFTQDLLDEC